MNLQVNLILKSEQRSGSPVSLKSVIRVASIAVPVGLLVMLSSAFANVVLLGNELRVLESQWTDARPRMEETARLNKELTVNRKIMKQLQGWKRSHIDWHEQMSMLGDEVPATIQLESLTVSQMLQFLDNKVPARVFVIMLKGKAIGHDAEQAVHLLQRGIEETPAFADLIETIRVIKYGADNAEDAREYDRVFQIECAYRPRRFE